MGPERWPRGPRRDLGGHIIHHPSRTLWKVKGEAVNNYAGQPADAGTVTVQPEGLVLLPVKRVGSKESQTQEEKVGPADSLVF